LQDTPDFADLQAYPANSTKFKGGCHTHPGKVWLALTITQLSNKNWPQPSSELLKNSSLLFGRSLGVV
jgi:hypothetical protein